MNNKIGLVLAFKGTNYGMHLQGFAIQQVLDSLGYKTLIIDYSPKGLFNGLKFQRGLLTFLFRKFIYNSFFVRIRKPVWTERHQVNNLERRKVSDAFRQLMLHDIIRVEGINELSKFANNFSSVLIGSDQMWIPGVSFGNFLSLRFVPNYIKKISYATSLGVSEYPKYCYESARVMWKNFNYISVREEEGKKIINEICPNKNVEVVADPTYLLTCEEWLEKVPFEKKIDGKYLLCYFLGNKESSKLCARRYADKYGLKLVSIVSNESASNIDFTYCDESIIGATVQDFINYIRGAECIFTDSFHGVAFSVINRKQFYVFYRKRDDAKQSRNSRIDNILRIWNLSSRLIVDEELIWDRGCTSINYNEVTPKILQFRDFSLQWLKNALES